MQPNIAPCRSPGTRALITLLLVALQVSAQARDRDSRPIFGARDRGSDERSSQDRQPGRGNDGQQAPPAPSERVVYAPVPATATAPAPAVDTYRPPAAADASRRTIFTNGARDHDRRDASPTEASPTEASNTRVFRSQEINTGRNERTERGDQAPRDVRPDRDHRDQGSHRSNSRDYYYDNRFNHDHYYLRRGYAIDRLSVNAWRTRHLRDDFYFDSGIWYRPFGGRFIVTTPPFGLFVPLLPPFYSTIWVRSYPYFYADDVYYRWEPARRGYLVSEPPDEAEVSTRVVAEGELYMYPKNQQSDAQQATDRYQCHRWATTQTGFDPTQPLGGVTASAVDGKRSDYRRAMAACLEARGYSVK